MTFAIGHKRYKEASKNKSERNLETMTSQQTIS